MCDMTHGSGDLMNGVMVVNSKQTHVDLEVEECRLCNLPEHCEKQRLEGQADEMRCGWCLDVEREL